jgi:hypothetical protein
MASGQFQSHGKEVRRPRDPKRTWPKTVVFAYNAPKDPEVYVYQTLEIGCGRLGRLGQDRPDSDRCLAEARQGLERGTRISTTESRCSLDKGCPTLRDRIKDLPDVIGTTAISSSRHSQNRGSGQKRPKATIVMRKVSRSTHLSIACCNSKKVVKLLLAVFVLTITLERHCLDDM